MRTLLAAFAFAVSLAAAAQEAPDAGVPEASAAAAPAPAADAGTAVAEADPTAQPRSPVITLSDRSVVKEEFRPTVKLLSSDLVELRVGGFMQVHTAMYAGPDALIANGDAANQAGFRLRRARIGLLGKLGERMGVWLAVNLLPDDPDVGVVSDAKLTYAFAEWLNVAVGTSKVPFSRASLASSRQLLGIERPLSAQQLTASKRIGVTAEGQFFGGKLAYLASVMNGTEGFIAGNQFGGVLLGGRLEFTPLGNPKPGTIDTKGLSVGVSAVHDRAPGVQRTAFSGDVVVAYAGASLTVEVLYDKSLPTVVPPVEGGTLALTERLGGYVEAGYAFSLFTMPFQLTARGEYYDDNLRLSDAGDVMFVSGGINTDLYKDYARAQLQFIHRTERSGVDRANDLLVLSVQGSF
ncbi:MAG: OprO/OprP family phosphate-selective porin [Myxococcaceae bacterium]|nr:OprO/OprP family phosphate-selective porin [Myxococcaceae bacterium]